MKSIFLLAACLFSLSLNTQAQSSLSFTVQQLPVLTIDAGIDSVVNTGDKIRLGGTTVASGGSGIYQYSWSPVTGLDSPFIARPLATIDTTITYQLTVEDPQACKKTSSIKITANRITATPDIFNQSGIAIYPNPAKSFFYIISEKPVIEKTITLELFDLSGRKVYAKTIKGNRKLNEEIKIIETSKGIYILKVTGSKNHFTRKIIFL